MLARCSAVFAATLITYFAVRAWIVPGVSTGAGFTVAVTLAALYYYRARARN